MMTSTAIVYLRSVHKDGITCFMTTLSIDMYTTKRQLYNNVHHHFTQKVSYSLYTSYMS